MKAGQLILNSTWRVDGPRRGHTILKEKNDTGGLILSDLKIYYGVIYSNQDSMVLNERTDSQANGAE